MKERKKLMKILKAGDALANTSLEVFKTTNQFGPKVDKMIDAIYKYQSLRKQMESIDD